MITKQLVPAVKRQLVNPSPHQEATVGPTDCFISTNLSNKPTLYSHPLIHPIVISSMDYPSEGMVWQSAIQCRCAKAIVMNIVLQRKAGE